MSIYLESKADLAAMFSVKAGVAATVSDLVFYPPQTPTSAEIIQFGHNTKIRIAFAPGSTLGVGSATVFYDRLDVAPLALANLRGVAVTAGINLTGMIPVLKNLTGVPFTTDDLVEHSSFTDTDGEIAFLLEAKPTSIGWKGSVTLAFNKAADIETAFTNDILPGF